MTNLMRRPNPATAGTEIIALAYKRASTEEQLKGYGLDVQDDELRAWEAEDARRTILETFSDEGVSGAQDRRPDMLRLEERAREGKANRIVVPKVDRVGRTARAAFNWAWRMQDIGVHFISIQERIDTSTELGWTVFQQYVFFSEMEWNSIRQRTRDGRNKKIEYGGWPAGPAPYGYRIEGKGQKGSFLVVCEGEARVILKSVALLVDGKASFEEAADELNRLELYTRSGKPWTTTNLYQRMHSETFDGYTTYRKANRGDRKRATRLNEDGTPVYGEPVRIAVPQILTPDRTDELKTALKKRSINKPRKPARIYSLSGHIASDCGQVYVGGGRTGQRAYRCQGNSSDKSACGCTNLDATEIENAVWSKVTRLLADEARLRVLADRRVVSLPGDRDKYLERQESLATSIEKHEKLIEDAVPEYIKAGLEPAVAAAAVKKLLEEVEGLRKQLEEVQYWLSEYEQTQARADAIVSLARSSPERLASLDAAEKAEIFDMFRIVVLPQKGRFVKRSGAPCKVTTWHYETGTLVPPDVSETRWEAAREVIAQYHGPRHFSMTSLDLRQALNGMLHRLRHGAEWSEIESWGHAEAIRQRQGVWFRSGAWQALMEHLTTDGRGTVAYRHPTIPLLHVVGEIRSGVLALMRATEDDLTELTEGESGNPISGMLRELAIDAEKIAKAIAKNGAGSVSRLPV
ncbi:recombinase family protein [Streptomyces sp. DG2A-72]|uniref:recombinase family protein n=1 Tax=Streptomyces sp. DG2A-72 TaxID=3051386 RepID=UPI00265C32B0|nr:recombinase family protein [Streptomyces sp. DG2A-72]MDO0933992.1 recombinase family protein [Streptomyces sp. DG2A-72]